MNPFLPRTASAPKEFACLSQGAGPASDPIVFLEGRHDYVGAAAARLDKARDRVTITRRIAGSLVLEAISLRRFCGVAVKLRPNTDGLVEVALVGADGLKVTLLREGELDSVVARWRAYGRDLCLPLIFIDEMGNQHAVTRALGRTVVRKALERRPRRKVSRWRQQRRRTAR